MKNHFDHLDEYARSIRLTDAERSAIRARLASEMQLTRRRAAAQMPVPVPSPYRAYLAWRPAFAALLVLVLAGGGTAFAAEGALPGDALYGVKVAVVEPVVGALQATAAARADWQVHLANERLAEADAVASSPTLATSTKAELAARAAIASENAASDISALAPSDPVAAGEAATRLNATFNAHRVALAALVASSDASATPVLAAALSASAAPPGDEPATATATPESRRHHAAAREYAPSLFEASSTVSGAGEFESGAPEGAGATTTLNAATSEDSAPERGAFDRASELFTHTRALAQPTINIDE